MRLVIHDLMCQLFVFPPVLITVSAVISEAQSPQSQEENKIIKTQIQTEREEEKEGKRRRRQRD